jgi:hypothetical protein
MGSNRATAEQVKRANDEINRGDIKAMINELIAKDLSRNTVRVMRGMFSPATESGLGIKSGSGLGRFTLLQNRGTRRSRPKCRAVPQCCFKGSLPNIIRCS